MASVGDGVLEDTFEEEAKNLLSLGVDERVDTLDTTTTSETADSGLSDTLDVVAENLASKTLGATLSESLASLSTSRHVNQLIKKDRYIFQKKKIFK